MSMDFHFKKIIIPFLLPIENDKPTFQTKHDFVWKKINSVFYLESQNRAENLAENSY